MAEKYYKVHLNRGKGTFINTRARGWCGLLLRPVHLSTEEPGDVTCSYCDRAYKAHLKREERQAHYNAMSIAKDKARSHHG